MSRSCTPRSEESIIDRGHSQVAPGFGGSRGAIYSDPRFIARYRPASEVYEARPGTLEHWLTERCCLYARDPNGRMWCTEVHHAPWPLQRAEAEIERNTFFESHGLQVSGSPLLHISRRIDVVICSPQRASAD